MLNSSRGKNEGTYRSGEGGEGPASDPGSELLLGGREGGREQCEDNKWMKEKNIVYPSTYLYCPSVHMSRPSGRYFVFYN